MMQVLLWNWLAIMLLVVALVSIRFEQEQASRRIAALRLARHEVMQ
jgi:hypothetical protein